MTDIESLQNVYPNIFNSFCRIVIHHVAISKILMLLRKWEREVSLDYLANEKFVLFTE